MTTLDFTDEERAYVKDYLGFWSVSTLGRTILKLQAGKMKAEFWRYHTDAMHYIKIRRGESP